MEKLKRAKKRERGKVNGREKGNVNQGEIHIKPNLELLVSSSFGSGLKEFLGRGNSINYSRK